MINDKMLVYLSSILFCLSLAFGTFAQEEVTFSYASQTEESRERSKPYPDDLQALLDMSIEELLNVKVITASRQEERITEAPATVMVITREQIRERGYEELEDVLRDLPGIDFVHVQGLFPTIWTQRGLYGDENKRTLVLIDGIVENNILEGNVLAGLNIAFITWKGSK